MSFIKIFTMDLHLKLRKIIRIILFLNDYMNLNYHEFKFRSNDVNMLIYSIHKVNKYFK